jgi:hypothetical protein
MLEGKDIYTQVQVWELYMEGCRTTPCSCACKYVQTTQQLLMGLYSVIVAERLIDCLETLQFVTVSVTSATPFTNGLITVLHTPW